MEDLQDYFEKGCLCYLTHRMKRPENSTVFEIVDYYIENCKCSRHPDSHQRDVELEAIMRDELKLNEKSL
jgi:hypothetical protein